MDTLHAVRDRLRLAQAWGEPSRLFLVAAELHVGRLEDHVGAGLVGPDRTEVLSGLNEGDRVVVPSHP